MIYQLLLLVAFVQLIGAQSSLSGSCEGRCGLRAESRPPIVSPYAFGPPPPQMGFYGAYSFFRPGVPFPSYGSQPFGFGYGYGSYGIGYGYNYYNPYNYGYGSPAGFLPYQTIYISPPSLTCSCDTSCSSRPYGTINECCNDLQTACQEQRPVGGINLAIETVNAKRKKAVTFAGGGWRAFIAHAGVVSGLLTRSDTSSIGDLFSSTDGIGCNSGGSWFAGDLLFSTHFNQVLADSAADPANAANLIRERVLDPFQASINTAQSRSIIDGLREFFDKLEELLKAAGSNLANYLPLIKLVVYNDLSWEQFVEKFMKASSNNDVNLDAAISNTAVLPWANGKQWTINGALSTPQGAISEIISYTAGEGSIRYQGELQGGSFPQDVPFIFRAKLGDASSPGGRPVVPALDNVRLKYTQRGPPSIFNSAGNVIGTQESSGALYDKMTNSEMTSILHAVATSSSFLGIIGQDGALPNYVETAIAALGVINDDLRAKVEQIILLLGGLHVGNQPMQQAFDSSLYDFRNLGNVAQSQVATVFDGAYADNFGLAPLLATGEYDTIVLFTDATLAKSAANTDDTSGANVMFTNGAIQDKDCTSTPFYCGNPLFAEDGSWYAAERAANETFFTIAPSSKRLTKLSMLTLEVTTTENTYFGIAAGQKITLHMIYNFCDISLTNIAWFEYGDYFQDVINTISLSENADMAQKLNSFFTS